MMSLAPITFAFFSSLLIAVILIATESLHGHLSHDSHAGVQKLHHTPVPRIGGLALLAGFGAGGLTLSASAYALWGLVFLATAPALAMGLVEDLTKRVGAKWRLVATIFGGLIFVKTSGYYLTHTGLPGVDWLLSFKWLAIAFTVIVMAGVANAFNIIDGVNGLSSGTALIVFAGFAIIAMKQGDGPVLALCLVSIGALAGFFLLNFPFGKIFLGDGGAYMTGFLLAVVALILPLRNPELSPLIGLLGLAYPIIEMLVSIRRRMVRPGAHPGRADRLHLHSLLYRGRARKIANATAKTELRNPITAMLLWPVSTVAVVIMIFARSNTFAILAGFLLILGLYIWKYRRVALFRQGRARQSLEV